MTDPRIPGVSRRTALKLGVQVGSLGVCSAAWSASAAPLVGINGLFGQQSAPVAAAPANPNFPQVPTWNTELRELAPGVYAYIQAGGPGRDNVSISNAGVIVGDDSVMVIDTLTAPKHA